MDISIEKVSNGYIVTQKNGTKEVHSYLDSVFDSMLSTLEGKSEYFGGDSFGVVKIFETPGEKYTVPDESELS